MSYFSNVMLLYYADVCFRSASSRHALPRRSSEAHVGPPLAASRTWAVAAQSAPRTQGEDRGGTRRG